MAKKGNVSLTDAQKADLQIALLQTLVAIELSKGGLSQTDIGKVLGISTGSVNKLIKGYKPPKHS